MVCKAGGSQRNGRSRTLQPHAHVLMQTNQGNKVWMNVNIQCWGGGRTKAIAKYDFESGQCLRRQPPFGEFKQTEVARPMPPPQLSRSAKKKKKKKRNSCPRSSISSSTADRTRRETRGPQTQTRERFGFGMLEMVGPCAMPLADDAGTWLYQSDLRHQKSGMNRGSDARRTRIGNLWMGRGEEGGQPGAEFILSQGATWPSIQSDASM